MGLVRVDVVKMNCLIQFPAVWVKNGPVYLERCLFVNLLKHKYRVVHRRGV